MKPVAPVTGAAGLIGRYVVDALRAGRPALLPWHPERVCCRFDFPDGGNGSPAVRAAGRTYGTARRDS